jgi:hypothetical protein
MPLYHDTVLLSFVLSLHSFYAMPCLLLDSSLAGPPNLPYSILPCLITLHPCKYIIFISCNASFHNTTQTTTPNVYDLYSDNSSTRCSPAPAFFDPYANSLTAVVAIPDIIDDAIAPPCPGSFAYNPVSGKYHYRWESMDLFRNWLEDEKSQLVVELQMVRNIS